VHAPSTGEFLLSSAVFVAALLVPFFLCDLFASLVCVAAVFSVTAMAGSLAAIPAFSGLYVAVQLTAMLLACAFAILCVARGKTWSEERVRPLYARHIAERKSLEAEVSAAREAQLRLLPEGTPEFAGLHISAVCVPAETVGGDFYDFFPLGDGRLGVFIAEGNTRGLAAALTIALAKGYLMQCVERFQEPVEILSRLETALASMFDRESVATDFAFAAIDTVRGEISYARTNSYPKVVVVSASGSAAASERMAPVKGRGSPIAEGRASLAPGDHVVLFTDGMGRRLAAGNRRPEDAAARLVADASSETALAIREKFFTATKASLEPDDLTVVVIRLQALADTGTTALGVVA
jgi:sigma-B regulation protein RsbU (phosphoserine phosphatase)